MGILLLSYIAAPYHVSFPLSAQIGQEGRFGVRHVGIFLTFAEILDSRAFRRSPMNKRREESPGNIEHHTF